MNLEEQIAIRIQGDVAVVGIGNPMRGDDAAGSMVARKIAAMSGVTVIDAEEVPENYLAAVVNRQPDTIVLIDSVDLDSAPGSVAILDREQLAGYGPSTHRVPVSLLMSLFEQETRARVFMIGIQPGHTEFLKPMSESVGTSVGQVAGMLNRVLGAHRDAAQGAAGNTSRAEVSA